MIESTTSKRKLEPTHIKSLLNRDVNAILRTCIHHFEDIEKELDEKYFDVDGVVAGRVSRENEASVRRSTTVKAHPVIQETAANPHFLRVPSRGNFIPASHFQGKFAIA
jgi:hypothetical protein